MIDQLQSYVAIGKQFASHERVYHGIKEFARGQVHVNTAESFNAILERAKQGVFVFVSLRHLPRYISEVAFCLNNRDPVEKKRNGLSKIVMQAKPVLEQLGVLRNQAVGTQFRRTIYGGVASPQLFCLMDRTETKYPRAQKFSPVKFHARPANVLAICIALTHFMYPTT